MSDINQAMNAIAKEHAETRRELAEVRQILNRLAPDRRAEIATIALEHFGRMAELYNEICAFLRAAQHGADGSA